MQSSCSFWRTRKPREGIAGRCPNETALSRVTRRTIIALGPISLRRVTPDRVLSFLATDLRNELRFAATRSHGLGGSVGCCDVVVRFSEPVRVREHTDDREPTLR